MNATLELPAGEADLQACRRLMKGGSKAFLPDDSTTSM